MEIGKYVELTRCGQDYSRAAKRRGRIIDAARILFINNGFHATGVAQIAKASGVAVGQIYRDFEAKEEIVARIVESDCAEFMARDALDRAIDSGDAAGAWAWIRQFVQPTDHADTAPLFAEIIAESARNRRIAAIFARTRDEVNGAMLTALALLLPGDAHEHRRALLADLILTQSLGLKQHVLVRPDLDTNRIVASIMSWIEHEIDRIRAVEATGQVPHHLPFNITNDLQ